MPSPAVPFHTAQEAALRAATDLAAAMGLPAARIYTEAPVNAVLPYVVIGDDQVLLENGEGCADQAEVLAFVHVWARKAPLDKGVQARGIGAAAIAALNADLTIAGWDLDLFELTSERYVTDPDQSTHGILEFRYLLTEQV